MSLDNRYVAPGVPKISQKTFEEGTLAMNREESILNLRLNSDPLLEELIINISRSDVGLRTRLNPDVPVIETIPEILVRYGSITHEALVAEANRTGGRPSYELPTLSNESLRQLTELYDPATVFLEAIFSDENVDPIKKVRISNPVLVDFLDLCDRLYSATIHCFSSEDDRRALDEEFVTRTAINGATLTRWIMRKQNVTYALEDQIRLD